MTETLHAIEQRIIPDNDYILSQINDFMLDKTATNLQRRTLEIGSCFV